MTSFFEHILFSGMIKRKNNLFLPIIKMIWMNKGITRKMLADSLGISKVAISKNIDVLIENGVVEEFQRAKNTQIKKSIPLYMKDGMFYSIGIFFSYPHALVTIEDNNDNVMSSFSVEYDRKDGAGSCYKIAGQIKEKILKCQIDMKLLAGVGIAFSGIMDLQTGSIENAAIFNDRRKIPLQNIFHEILGVPCSIMNTSSLLAKVEHQKGNAAGINSFVYFTSGYGLGMFFNGQLYNGYQHNAGEAGFMQLSEEGPVNIDGRKGTLGAMKPMWEIPSKIREIMESGGKHSIIMDIVGGDLSRIDDDAVCYAASKGDRLCFSLLEESFTYIGKAVVNLAYILNPEAFFFEPLTAQCEECTLEVVRRQMRSYGLHNWKFHSEISAAKCGYDSLPSAAAELPVENLFKSVENVYCNGN